MSLKQIEVVSCFMDIVIIFSPFLLLTGKGVELFIWSFYFIYLPYLLFNIYKYNQTKKHKKHIDCEIKKISENHLVINQ
jgi:hypothetical protein